MGKSSSEHWQKVYEEVAKNRTRLEHLPDNAIIFSILCQLGHFLSKHEENELVSHVIKELGDECAIRAARLTKDEADKALSDGGGE
jgi:hypothetical protein